MVSKDVKAISVWRTVCSTVASLAAIATIIVLGVTVLHEVLKDFRKEEVKDEGNNVELMGDDLQSEGS